MDPQKEVSKSYYDILGVSETARAEDVKKAYRKAAMKMHPDKGGESGKFQELVEAFEVLSDPVKRIAYDKKISADARSDLVSESQTVGAALLKRITSLFAGLRKSRGDDAIVQLPVTLADLYSGRLMTVAMRRIVTCSKCEGSGSKSGELLLCTCCLGAGVRIDSELVVLHDGCNVCDGTGVMLREEDRCDRCQGRRTVRRDNWPLTVTVKKGMHDDHRIRVRGLGDEWPGRKTGDVVVVLRMLENPKFKRRVDDLFVDHTLTLTEALCGCEFRLTHLDQRRFLISVSGQNLRSGQCAFMKDAGMPIYSLGAESSQRGRLYICFKVEYPDAGSLTSFQLRVLETILPPRPDNELRCDDLLECEDAEIHFVSCDANALRESTLGRFSYTLLP